MPRLLLFSRFFAFVCILLPYRTASADPVAPFPVGVDVSGVFEVISIGHGAAGGIFSDGTASVFVGGTGRIDAFQCWPLCQAGTEVSFSGSFSSLTGYAELTSPTIVLPHVQPGLDWTVSLPFTFIAGESSSPQTPILQWLEGGGIVTANFRTRPWYLENAPEPIPPEHAGTFFSLRAVTFFSISSQEPPAPAPEPATILLIGSGLAGLAACRRRRSQRGGLRVDR